MLVLFVGLVGVTGWWFTRLPTGFLPTEDQGYAIVGIQLPDAASQARTREVVGKVNEILAQDPRRRRLVHDRRPVDPRAGDRLQRGGDLRHLDPLGGADGHARAEPGRDPRQADGAGSGRSGRRWSSPSRRRRSSAWGSPAGFEMQVEDRGGVGLEELQQVVDEMIADGNAQTTLSGRPVPLPVRRAAALRRRRPGEGQEPRRPARRRSSARSRRRSARPTSTTSTSSAGPTRSASRPTSSSASEPEDIRRLEVRNRQGQMVPLGTLAKVEERLGPQIIPRYNLYPSASITGEAAPGYSSGAGPEAHGADGRQQAAGVDGLRMDRHVVPGEAGRLAGDLRLRPGGADGLPRAGRAVRELDDARRGDPGRARWPCWGRSSPSRSAGWTTTSTRRSASC